MNVCFDFKICHDPIKYKKTTLNDIFQLSKMFLIFVQFDYARMFSIRV